MNVVALDLEGVLVPEIWIGVAERTGIEALRLTTRDIEDYDELMQRRLGVLDEHRLVLGDIEAVIATLDPLEGAADFLARLREHMQVVILSDTFYQFAGPLMHKLGWPALWCHRLEVEVDGRISGYRLRQQDPKRRAVEALRGLNFRVLAVGDSYNDVNMLQAANAGIFFRPPPRISQEYPQFPVVASYVELDDALARARRAWDGEGGAG
ncbi:MAG: bifunctional phosphoserine phosphatase/homoserine phosphotransferase ThrH [Gammaproteobacteria bacterium]